MSMRTHRTRAGGKISIALVAALAAVMVTALVASGCTPAAKSGGTPASKPASSTMPSATVPASGTVAASDVQTCAECNKKGMGPKVAGAAVVDGGVQVVNVGIVNGYYSPNAITAKAGTPIKVVFSGKAKGCIAKPKFGALKKSIDITTTGSGTIDLGALQPGVYEFTCGMGMSKSTITVQ